MLQHDGRVNILVQVQQLPAQQHPLFGRVHDIAYGVAYRFDIIVVRRLGRTADANAARRAPIGGYSQPPLF